MGLAADLGYLVPRQTTFHRYIQAFASSRPGASLFAKSLRHVDNVVGRLTGGRTSAPELLAGLPVIDVTTTGRTSGRRRTSHLIAVPYADTLALLGTNFGQPSTPAWVLNVEADPRVTLRHHGTVLEAVARPATEEERAAVLAASAAVYRGYLKYQSRISGRRRLRIFVLESA
ncbi:MAG TPA: nitroreductase family deazaflavin-dependent oxidoreductase [Nocardioides sp.]|nr:nitroreductase family deazaflavin-dependent oxidoreductase [Nocardioides sp.]